MKTYWEQYVGDEMSEVCPKYGSKLDMSSKARNPTWVRPRSNPSPAQEIGKILADAVKYMKEEIANG